MRPSVPPVPPSQPLIFTALLFIHPNEIFPLAGLVKVEGCYFSNNLGFVGRVCILKGVVLGGVGFPLPFSEFHMLQVTAEV